MANILALLVITVYVTVYPHPSMQRFLEMSMPPSMGFRGLILGLAAVNYIVCLCAEVRSTFCLDLFYQTNT